MGSICVRHGGRVETLSSFSVNAKNYFAFVTNVGLKRALRYIMYLENKNSFESFIVFDGLVYVG